MKCVGALITLLVFWIKVSTDAAEWNYGNVSEWGGLCVTGTQQSPIDLVADDSAGQRIFSSFQFTNYDLEFPAKMKNNGHTVTITLNTSAVPTMVPTISGGGLIEPYLLDHFHFHWQSEHTVDGYRFPLEMHIVHYSSKYANTTEASANPGGLAVLGVLFELSIDDDKDFIPLVEVMQNVQSPNVEVELNRNIRARSFLPRNTGDYYRYTGSLTTPGCNEGVIWTVFHRTLPLSADQVEHFESVWATDGPLTLNFRPVQPLNNRVISVRNIPRTRGGASTLATSFISIIILVTLPIVKTHLF